MEPWNSPVQPSCAVLLYDELDRTIHAENRSSDDRSHHPGVYRLTIRYFNWCQDDKCSVGLGGEVNEGRKQPIMDF